MTSAQIEIQLIAVVVAAACALPGAFLVLRRTAMLSDAISHAILPGIALAFFATRSLHSPLLVIAAAATGVVTVGLIEALARTGRVKQDAAIGLVFPVLFSVGVILITQRASDVHLDADAVLLGELAFAPFNRLVIGGVDVGPQALWTMGPILLLNIAFILLFYKELKLATFDRALAAALGFAPTAIHYALMSLVSVTAVGAFDAVGSVLVVAFVVGPPAAAYLLTDRLAVLLGLSAALGAVSGVGGYWLARVLDASIAGSMAAVVGIVFAAVFLLAPQRGIVAQARLRRERRARFAQKMLAVHLLHHEGTEEAERECRMGHLQEHLRWTSEMALKTVTRAERRGLVRRRDGRLGLTSEGRAFARTSMVD